MKNSRQYSQKIQKLYRSLKRKHNKISQVFYEEPMEAIVYAIISEKLSEKTARTTYKKLADYFVDLNDLRVSLTEEIIELLPGDTHLRTEIARGLTTTLMAVFDKYNVISLEDLKKTGKRPARTILEKLRTISDFVVDYCVLTSLKGHAIPLTADMIEYLKAEELVHPNADENEIAGFLTRQISLKNGYEFYALLRQESDSYKPRKKKTSVRPETETTKKVKKKSVSKTSKKAAKRRTKKKTTKKKG